MQWAMVEAVITYQRVESGNALCHAIEVSATIGRTNTKHAFSHSRIIFDQSRRIVSVIFDQSRHKFTIALLTTAHSVSTKAASARSLRCKGVAPRLKIQANFADRLYQAVWKQRKSPSLQLRVCTCACNCYRFNKFVCFHSSTAIAVAITVPRNTMIIASK